MEKSLIQGEKLNNDPFVQNSRQFAENSTNTPKIVAFKNF